MIKYGFIQSGNDHRLFILKTDVALTILLVYIDDVLLTGNCSTTIQQVKNFFDTTFTIKDLGFAKYFLGIEIVRFFEGTFISQKKYITDIITATSLKDAKTVSLPM